MTDKLEPTYMWGGINRNAEQALEIQYPTTDIQFVAKMQEELCEYKEFIAHLKLCACKKECVSRIKFDN